MGGQREGRPEGGEARGRGARGARGGRGNQRKRRGGEGKEEGGRGRRREHYLIFYLILQFFYTPSECIHFNRFIGIQCRIQVCATWSAYR